MTGTTRNNQICQLIELSEWDNEISWFEDKIQFVIQEYHWYKIISCRMISKRRNLSVSCPILNFKPGDKLRVLPEHTIKVTLNHLSKTNECTFQQGKYGYCDAEYV
jgi:hypothetical protein